MFNLYTCNFRVKFSSIGILSKSDNEIDILTYYVTYEFKI